MLHGAELRTPTALCTAGFLTVNGQKMSKSRGTFITAQQYLKHLHPEYLRYYFAAKLNSHVEDTDLNFEDFMQRINADLVGKIVNIASRLAGFVKKKFHLTLASQMRDATLFQEFIDAGDSIAQYYEQREFSRTIRKITELADKANQYIAEKAPWQLIKDEKNLQQVHEICTLGLNLFRVIITYLKPVLPELASKVENFLNCEPLTWENHKHPLLDHKINVFTPLLQRIEAEHIAPLQQSHDAS